MSKLPSAFTNKERGLILLAKVERSHDDRDMHWDLLTVENSMVSADHSIVGVAVNVLSSVFPIHF